MDGKGTIIPTMRYRDANAALAWLGRAFGFEEHAVYRDDEGAVVHAELVLGNGMIMLGQVRDTPYGRFVKQPDEIGKTETQAPYIVVADADAHYARAKASGAEILLDITTQDYGGRDYTCRDPEGHIWNFGTYDPWAPG
jgi:uncharacterized glyoxalase superfamily protein PhnB